MSLFNAVAGVSPTIYVAAEVMGWQRAPSEFHRFRDAYIDPRTKPPTAVLMTRTGDGAWTDEGADANAKITHMEGFIEAWNDDFDKTFRYHRFKIPDEGLGQIEAFIETVALAHADGDVSKNELFELPMDRFKRKVDKMGAYR